MKKTKNFNFLGKKKYEIKFNNPIFLIDEIVIYDGWIE